MLMIKANASEADSLREILTMYENCSSHSINMETSVIMFSKNTGVCSKNQVKRGLGIANEAWNEKYLELPVHVGRSRKKAFGYIKDRLWGRLQGYMEKLLNKTGREVLVKAVAEAIPTYAMSVFYLTREFCDELSALIGRFWWSQQDNESKIHWLGWKTLTKSKSQGGLGFRDIHNFNNNMLSRQVWRLIQLPESLCARVLRARYFPDGNIMVAQATEDISYAWRSLLHGLELVKQGYIWRIGKGSKVRN